MCCKTKQGIEDYEEQDEDSSDSDNEYGMAVTSASYDEVCIISQTACCLFLNHHKTHPSLHCGQDQDDFDESADEDEYDDYDDEDKDEEIDS